MNNKSVFGVLSATVTQQQITVFRDTDKSGRITYNIGLLIICISEAVFSFLGKSGIITDHKVIVLYLFGLFVFRIITGNVVHHQLRKKY